MAKIFTIDTLEFSKELIKAGMAKKPAEVLAEKIKETQEESVKDLVTKEYLEQALQITEQRLLKEIKGTMFTAVISISVVVALIQKFI